MARKPLVGEKPLYWVGSSKKDLLAFPEPVKNHLGTALSVAQFGGKHPAAKPWRCRASSKSPRGIKTSRPDIDLVWERLRMAQQDYEERHGKTEQ